MTQIHRQPMVYCAACGTVLEFEADWKDRGGRYVVGVKPCPSCTEDARSAGYSHGHDVGLVDGKDEAAHA